MDGPRPDEVREAVAWWDALEHDGNVAMEVVAIFVDTARAYLSILDDPAGWLREQGAVDYQAANDWVFENDHDIAPAEVKSIIDAALSPTSQEGSE